MELSDVPDGSTIAVDANILIYYFTGASGQCVDFIERVASGRVIGWLGAHVMAEVAHRLMVQEAQATGLVSGGNPAKKLKQRPGGVLGLTQYQTRVQSLALLMAAIHPLTLEVVERSAEVRDRYGLLTNDSLLIAMMQVHGTTALATADRDFLRLPDLQVHVPSDV